MSFLTSLFNSSKGTPVDTNTLPRTSGEGTPDGTDEDWEFVTAHEAGVIYHDRITILLGPHRETRHHILIADMPKSSDLLNYVLTLDPSHRHVHLLTPDLPMVKSYLKSLFIPIEALAIEQSWMDIIKLAITADVFQDSYMEGRALAGLKHKGIIAFAPGNAVLLFKDSDFSVAQEYNTRTGNGESLIKTLCEVAELGTVKPEKTKTLNLGSSKPHDMKPRSNVSQRKIRSTRYSSSVLRCSRLGHSKKGSDEDDKVHPIRQPSVPPSVETLRHGDASNFTWPKPKDVRK
jgi:hypothetical protein